MTERIGIVAVRDEDLVERAAGGDVDAFEALVAARLNRAFRSASAILDSEADANDGVQDAFVATWRHLPKLRDRTKFGARTRRAGLPTWPRSRAHLKGSVLTIGISS